ncbi:MAG: hypothetical protein K0Q59_1798, partial [Paenibacillus sp.]|nr:hypothetical protein [Paenibacillus sp.]
MDSQHKASERGGLGRNLSRRKLIASFGLIAATFATGGLMRAYGSPGNEAPTNQNVGDAEIGN